MLLLPIAAAVCYINYTAHTYILWRLWDLHSITILSLFWHSCVVPRAFCWNEWRAVWLADDANRERENDFADSILYFVVVDGGRCPGYYSTVVAAVDAAAIVVHASTLWGSSLFFCPFYSRLFSLAMNILWKFSIMNGPLTRDRDRKYWHKTNPIRTSKSIWINFFLCLRSVQFVN